MSATLADVGFDIDRLANCDLGALRDKLDDLDQAAASRGSRGLTPRRRSD